MNEMTQVLGVVAMEPKGEYDASTYYEKLNTVLYNDSTYMAKESVQGENPSTSDKWQLIGGGVTNEDVSDAIQTTIEDSLTSEFSTKSLSAKQGKILNDNKININDIIDNLTSSETSKPLSAKQGKELKSIVDDKMSLLFGATTDRPTANIETGQMYFDTTLNVPIWYDGTNWVDVSGNQI